ncbi:metallopeptidase family protein [Caldisericum exile]|uniref:metallopeptidase family protein n=1 Tax=Caldisericum exile TaxID=693075 RepID=UPI00030B9B6C|nr:metallopeptidase family protein [Caldisericum exile]
MDEILEFFRDVIDKTISNLPKDLKDKIQNLEFIILDYPTEDFLESNGLKNQTLLGLYVGVPLNKRGANYNWVLPDRIYIFMQPIIYFANLERIPVEEKIRKVVLHEIGHYFGMGEDDLRLPCCLT